MIFFHKLYTVDLIDLSGEGSMNFQCSSIDFWMKNEFLYPKLFLISDAVGRARMQRFQLKEKPAMKMERCYKSHCEQNTHQGQKHTRWAPTSYE